MNSGNIKLNWRAAGRAAAVAWLVASPAMGQLPDLTQPEPETAAVWQPPELSNLPADWWSQFDTVSPEIRSTRMERLLSDIEERVAGMAADNIVTARNKLTHLRSLLELLTVEEQGPLEESFESIPARDSYLLEEMLALRAQWRELESLKSRIRVQIEQLERQLRLLQGRRDDLLRQYQSAPEESPGRIITGIDRVSARIELELAETRLSNLQVRLDRISRRGEKLAEQLAYARGHLVTGDTTVEDARSRVAEARGELAEMTQKVTALQSQLLEALSTDPVNTSLELLRKQQLTRASAEAELAGLQLALAEVQANWYRFRAGQLDDDYNYGSALAESRRLSEDALKQVEVWASISQATLIASGPADSLNAIKNFELAQSAARDTLFIVDRIRGTSDELLLVHDILGTEILGAQSGLSKARARFVLALRNFWAHVVSFTDLHLFSIGEAPVTPGGLVKMLLILVLAFAISWFLRHLIMRSVGTDRVTRSPAIYTLGRLMHYVIVLIGVFVAMGSIGIDFTSFALIAGALSVGIGFGLQAIVNNFVSGLILLFEGTLRVEDYIELDTGLSGVVKEINTRATVINTNDGVDVVVPNSDLVTFKLTNWTLRETVARMRIPFGVAYGSDKEKVREVALEAAAETDFVLLNMPGRDPQVRLVNFGDSALEFELLVWVSRQGVRRPHRVRASFLWALETRLHDAGIVVPFPQRDVHIKETAPTRVRLEPVEKPDG